MVAHTVTNNDNSGLTDAGLTRGRTLVIQETGFSLTDVGTLVQRVIGLEISDTLTMSDPGASAAISDAFTDGALDVALGDPRTIATSGSGAQSLTHVVTDAAFSIGSDTPNIVGGSPPVAPPDQPAVTIITGLPRVIVEVGFALIAPATNDFILDDATNGRLDTAALAGGQTWVDVSPWVMSGTISRGARDVSPGPGVTYEAGTLTVDLLNDDRRFDPTNMASPYVVAGRTQVRPMRPIRVRAIWQGQEYHRFRGFVDAWADEGGSPVHQVTTVTATDGFKVLQSERDEGGTVLGAGEASGARIHRILDTIEWAPGLRRIATGDVLLQGTTNSGNALAEMQLVTDTEVGGLFMSTQGEVVFHSRTSAAESPTGSTSQATFGSNIAAGELPYVTVTREYSDSDFANRVLVSREGGVEQVVQDDVSVEEYLVHGQSRTGLLFQNDAESLAYAQYWLSVASQPQYRFTDLEIDPRADAARLFPQVLGRDFGDRITVKRRPPGGGDPVVQDVHIRGVEEAFGNGRWYTRWVLQSATQFSVLRLDHPTLGTLGTNRLGF